MRVVPLQILFAPLVMVLSLGVWAQNDQCDGGALKTHDAYLYGRFETRMSSTQGSGIVSSFFLYNWDLDCNWPAAVNEIDIEMTGNLDNSVQFTTHHPYLTSVTEIVPTPFNPHTTMVDYAIEWEPNIVRWFINGEATTYFTHQYISELVHPMRIFMNLWAVENLNWTGTWDPSAMPGMSKYEYVKYYAYTPGTGNAGTSNNYTLEWADEFETLDPTRWDQSEDGSVGPLCTFRGANVEVVDGQLQLSITAPNTSIPTRPVTFGVDASSMALAPSDVIYVAGGFNGWCANCDALQEVAGDGIWTSTLELPLGEHEYQYVVNGWGGAVSQPSLASTCDYNPCDEWTNYGVSVDEEVEHVYAELHCWNTCNICGSLAPILGCAEDLDGDLFVGVNDVLLLLGEFGCASSCAHDLNEDGQISIADVLAMLGMFGLNCG